MQTSSGPERESRSASTHWLFYRAEMCQADHPSAFSAPGSPDEGAGRFYLICCGIQRRLDLISSGWWVPTQKSQFIYKTGLKGRFPVGHEEDRDWKYFTSSTSEEGKLLLLALCKAGERASVQTKSGPACFDPNKWCSQTKKTTRFFLFINAQLFNILS